MKAMFLFLLVFAFINIFPQANIPSKEEFQKLSLEWQKAYNNKDASKLSELYTEDANYYSQHVIGLVKEGREAVVDNFIKGALGGGYIDNVEVLTVDGSCDMSVLTSKYTAINSGVKVSGRNILVLKKINDKWLIIKHMTVV